MTATITPFPGRQPRSMADSGAVGAQGWDNGDVPLPFPETLDDVLIAWRLHGLAAGHSERTITGRGYTLRKLAAYVDPLRATADDLEAWMAGLTGMSRSSRSTYRAQIRAFYVWAAKSGRRVDNPAVDMPGPTARRGIPHPVTPGEVERILASCADPRAQQTRAYVLLGAYAGLRVHEIAKVRGEDVQHGELLVTGKGDVASSVPLHAVVAALADTMPAAGWWFPSSSPAGHVHRCSVSSAIARAMARAGVPGVPHSLRHHFCTQVLRASGGDLRTTQRAARHASPATTAVYTQVADETLTRAVLGIPA